MNATKANNSPNPEVPARTPPLRRGAAEWGTRLGQPAPRQEGPRRPCWGPGLAPAACEQLLTPCCLPWAGHSSHDRGQHLHWPVCPATWLQLCKP